MEGEVKSIKANAFKLSWFMRGGISYTDVLNLSIGERELITGLIEENLDTTKKTNLPFF
jgi:hypothetical protein